MSDIERRAFERAAVASGHDTVWDGDQYLYEGMQTAWEVWQAARAHGAEPVAELFTDEYGDERFRWLTGADLPEGTLFYTQPQSAGAPENRPLQPNRYGVDRDYFTKKLEIIIRDMRDYTPDELARSLGRLAMVADSDVMQEPEFTTTPQPAGDWVRCSERLPTEADSDALGFVWTFSKGLGITVLDRHAFTEPPFYSHWMPTGLKRPQPPREQDQK